MTGVSEHRVETSLPTDGAVAGMASSANGLALAVDRCPKERQLTLDDLTGSFLERGRVKNRVGLEIEYGLVRHDSSQVISYGGADGSRALIRALMDEFGTPPIIEGSTLTGTRFANGASFNLEMAGALEYASSPQESLSATVTESQSRLRRAARTAQKLGIGLMSGGYLPFTDPKKMSWVPKPRTSVMRRHFSELGPAGRFGDAVMGTTLSTQVSVDAISEEEYLAKLGVLLGVSPFAGAIFATTPNLTGSELKFASKRLEFWRAIDPERCQLLSAKLWDVRSFRELAEALASVPMIYRRTDESYVSAPRTAFDKLMERGFEDGCMPSMQDWQTHLRQVWPTVRPRQTLETRMPDGQRWEHFAAVPAFFVGLTEDANVRGMALDIVRGFSAEDLDGIAVQAARDGWRSLSAKSKEAATEIVSLALSGLRRRVQSGLESPELLSALDPVLEVIESDTTLSDRVRNSWDGVWAHDPRRYADAMMVPTL